MKGRQIQNYVIGDLIGEGGMGAVYNAHHILMPQRKAAVKVLNASLSNNEHIRERFRNEAATLARLNHPRIVAFYDYIEENKEAFLVMELAEGVPLDVLIKNQTKIPELQAQELLRQIAETLAFAHSQGVLHRDIKPSNFIVNAQNKVKILDFGIAKMLSEESRQLTKTGMRMGSIYFMSPEQVRGDRDVSHRSDLYSLGLMYYVMLTGEYPLQKFDSEYMMYDAIINKEIIDTDTLKNNISEVSIQIIRKCLQKDPKERFSTGLEMAKLLPSTDTPAFSEARLVVLETEAPKVISETVGEIIPKKKSSLRNIWLLVILVIVGIVIALQEPYRSRIVALIQRGNPSDNTSKTPQGIKMYVVAMGLNLRDAPATGVVIATMPYGEVVYVLGESKQKDWLRVQYGDREGFVHAGFIADHLKPLYKSLTQSYFYENANFENPTVSYIVANQLVLAEKEENGFIYAYFVYNGKTTKGWLHQEDLERVK